MAIDSETLRTRLAAARLLRGFSQKDLDAAAHELGLGKQEAGRVERGELAWRGKHSLVFCQILRLPPRWFTEETDVIVGLRPAGGLTAATSRDLLEQLLAGFGQAEAPVAPGTPTSPAGEGQADRDRGADAG